MANATSATETTPHPEEVVQGENRQHRERDGDHHAGRQPSHHAPVGQEPVRPRHQEADTARPDDHHATLARPAKAIMTTGAASSSTKADRASQRRCVIAYPLMAVGSSR
jgi:hypothetical protein